MLNRPTRMRSECGGPQAHGDPESAKAGRHWDVFQNTIYAMRIAQMKLLVDTRHNMLTKITKRKVDLCHSDDAPIPIEDVIPSKHFFLWLNIFIFDSTKR